MPRGKHTIEYKQDLLRDILNILKLPSAPEYFSKGGTCTAKGLEVIRNELIKLKQNGKLNN